MYIVNIGGITDPFFNLALEEYLIQNHPATDTFVFLYINESSVVIGRNQNPWQEANIGFLEKTGVPIARRISGGGTVYHDSGNVNFSFITKHTDKSFNNYIEFTRPVITYLKSLGIKAELNERNDLVIGERKISGNAQFSSRNRLLSHGTLLVNSDLEMLRKSLFVKDLIFESRSTQSTRSSVTSLSEYSQKEITGTQVLDELRNVFISELGAVEYIPDEVEITKIKSLAYSKFNSFEWIYGRTHPFIVSETKEKGLRVEVKEGQLVTLFMNDELLFQKEEGEGIRFTPDNIIKSLELADRLKQKILTAFF